MMRRFLSIFQTSQPDEAAAAAVAPPLTDMEHIQEPASNTRPQLRSPSPQNQSRLYAEASTEQSIPSRQTRLYSPQPMMLPPNSQENDEHRASNMAQIQSDHELALRLQAEEHARYQAVMQQNQNRSQSRHNLYHQTTSQPQPQPHNGDLSNHIHPSHQYHQHHHQQHHHQQHHHQQQHHQQHHHQHHQHHQHEQRHSSGHSQVNIQSTQLANATHIAVREYPPQGSNEPIRQHLIPLPSDPAMRQRILTHLLEQVARNRQAAQGASQNMIRALPTFQVTEGSMAEGGQCNICLEDYVKGDEIKILPCAHMFHTSCTDAWIVRNKTCPVCKHDVDKFE